MKINLTDNTDQMTVLLIMHRDPAFGAKTVNAIFSKFYHYVVLQNCLKGLSQVRYITSHLK